MRTTSFKLLTAAAVAKYPDEVCFAFNPNFIEIESNRDSATLVVTVAEVITGGVINARSINASMYSGSVKIYISRLLELLFENPHEKRSLTARVSVSCGSVLFSFDTIVVWGNLAMNERFCAYGVYDADSSSKSFIRKMMWFKNFPMTVSVFRYKAGLNLYGRYDSTMYDGSTLPLGLGDVYTFQEIDNVSTPDLTADDVNDNVVEVPTKIVYLSRLKRFAALNGTSYCPNWNSNSSLGIGNQQCYEDGDNDYKPFSENASYVLCDDNGMNRYEFTNDELVYVAPFSNDGFIDLDVHDLFPKATRTATIKYQVSDEKKKTSTFDSTFDYTFFNAGDDLGLINFEVSDDKAGFYLRWIDRHGYKQYFLFTKGQTSFKNSPGSSEVFSNDTINDMYFANNSRVSSISCTVTNKCCAVHLDDDVFAYVNTILSSPLIDLYFGKDSQGREIWLPVNIESSTVTYDPNQQLHDVEISFATPDINAQSL
jgi:hypothetical protein